MINYHIRDWMIRRKDNPHAPFGQGQLEHAKIELPQNPIDKSK